LHERLLVIPLVKSAETASNNTNNPSEPWSVQLLKYISAARGGLRIAVAWGDIPWAERPMPLMPALPGAILQKSVKFSRSQVVGCNEATGLGVTALANCPMRRSWLNRPKSSGARATAHGAFNHHRAAKCSSSALRNYKLHEAQGRGRLFQKRTFLMTA